MINREYDKLCDATTLTESLKLLFPQHPTGGYRFYGVSTEASIPPRTVVHLVDDITAEEIAQVDAKVGEQ